MIRPFEPPDAPGLITLIHRHTENKPMLALNDELGFDPTIVYQDFVKELR